MPVMRLSRLAILGAGLFLAGCAARSAALAYWRATPDAPVPSLFASDPRIVLNRSGPQLLSIIKDPVRARELEGSIRQALKEKPLDGGALFELGAIREAREQGAGEELFLLAEKVSRRVVVNELMLSRAFAAEGDLAGAIVRFDRAFTVQPQLVEEMIPSLVPQLNDPDVRAEFLRYSARAWYPQLLNAAITANVAPGAIAQMIDRAAGRQDASGLDWLRGQLFAKAVANRDYGAVKALAAKLPAVSRLALGQIGFSKASTDLKLGPMRWNLLDNADGSAQLTDDGALRLSIASERSRTLAERLTLLSPAEYAVTQVISYDDSAPMATLTWELVCDTPEGAVIWNQTLPRHGGRGTYRYSITIPANCPAQRWRLQALGEASSFASEAVLAKLDLTHAN
jgi:hypothetical protein